jgi:hypothetical protein
MERDLTEDLLRWFPNLNPSEDRITSDASDAYNCVAWAVGETERVWERGSPRPSFWPGGVAGASVRGWMRVFELQGYEVCHTPDREPGYEKIAIYVSRDGSVPNHVARQLEDGGWTSKLGLLEDIRHGRLEALVGDEYGVVGPDMRRRRDG